MNSDDYNNNDTTSTAAGGRSHLPLVLGLAGAALGALACGFVLANALGDDAGSPSVAPVTTTTPTEAVSTPAPAITQQPSPVGTQPVEPTIAPPSATPIPPTPVATVPAITTSKFQDFFRAEGGSVYQSVKTALPLRRADASWNNSYKGCPGSASCIRGKVTAWAALGPFTIAERPDASALVYNTFTASRSDASLLMNIKWSGTLAAVASANADAETEVQVIVSEINSKTGKPTKAVAGMPYTVMSKGLGLEAIQGVDTVTLKDSRMINVPMKLSVGTKYRIELKVSCSARASLSLSVTSCQNEAEWTSMVVEYDQGICSPNQTGAGCIYSKN